MPKILNRVGVKNKYRIMGSGPKTKVECDREIAQVQSRIEYMKAKISSMPNGKPGSSEACNKGQAKHTLANLKSDLAQLKAKRKSLS